MAKVDGKALGIARVYCRSVLDLAEGQGLAETIRDELGEIAGLMERDPAFARFLSSPLVDKLEREQSLETLFRGRASDLLVDTLQVLNRKKRLPILPALCELYRRELETLRGRVEARVATAVELTDALRGKLTEALAQVTGKTPVLVETVDASMLGGLVVRVGDQKFDGSVRHQVEKLRHILHDRGRQEIYKSRQETAE